MHEELIQAFDLADADDDVRVVIVTGEGRGFCAGADLERGGETFDWRERQARGRDGGGQRRRTCRATAAASSRCGSSGAPSR